MGEIQFQLIDPLLPDAQAEEMLKLCERYGSYGMYGEESIEDDMGEGLTQRHDAVLNFLKTGGRGGRNEPLARLAARTNYFREEYAYAEPLVKGIEPVLGHPGFIEASKKLYGCSIVEPSIVYANILVPGQELTLHTDVPEFRGINRKSDPQWLIVAMHHSGLFDKWRMRIATGVSWFGHPRGGGFVFYPDGPYGPPVEHSVRHNTAILLDTERVIEAFHDPAPGAMTRIVVAPCSPFSVTEELMRESANLARRHGVHLHTHVAETYYAEQFCIERFGRRPVELMEDLGWVGDDVWYAHGVYINDGEIDRLAESGTGIAHCPSSNMRLGSGIAPVRRYLAAGVRLGIGVDGSASNDGSHLLGEARQAMLLSRLAAAPSIEGGRLLTAREVLRIATRGSAAVLGRDDIGSLEPGRGADFIAISLDRIEYAGALHDPVAAVLFAAAVRVDHSFVHGKPVVRDGELVGVELPKLIEEHNRAAKRLVG